MTRRGSSQPAVTVGVVVAAVLMRMAGRRRPSISSVV
jgi:hypothetical protein